MKYRFKYGEVCYFSNKTVKITGICDNTWFIVEDVLTHEVNEDVHWTELEVAQ